MGNYHFGGKRPQLDLNAKQAKICDIATKYKTWDNDTVESLGRDWWSNQPSTKQHSNLLRPVLH